MIDATTTAATSLTVQLYALLYRYGVIDVH